MTVLFSGPARVAVAIIGCALAGAYLVWLGWAMAYGSYDVAGALIIAPVLLAATVPLARRAARIEGSPRFTGFLLAAASVKLVGAVARYVVAFEVYNSGDAGAYHNEGARLAPFFRSGDFGADLGQRFVGTGFVRAVTGFVYVFTGPTKLGGFLVFSWFGFWGLYFFYRALRVAVPGADHRRYALLVFFLPSLVFWSSSIGKEAWMTLTIGLAAYGSAKLLTGRSGGLLALGAGLVGTALVRPHVTLVVFLALFVAVFVRRPARPTMTRWILKLLTLVVLVGIGTVVLHQVENFFGIDSVNTQTAEEVFTETDRRSSQGGSEFEATGSPSLRELPSAAVSVLFRPFPFEAHNAGALFASLEGAVLLALCVVSWRRLLSIPRAALRYPYVAFALVFVAVFVFAFASIGNFGILVRQRVQVMPLFLVLLAVPAPMRSVRPGPGTGTHARTPGATHRR